MTEGGDMLSRPAKEVLWQLFSKGAVFDGDIISKDGREELIDFKLAARFGGFTILTMDGLKRAIAMDMPNWRDPYWPGGAFHPKA